MDITIESVNEKLKKGESLSKEENQFVMSMPPDGEVPAGDKINFEEAEDLDKKKAEEEKQEEAEEERDRALFREAKSKREPEAKSEADEDPLASLDNQDPDAFLTVKEVKEVLKKALKQPERKEDSSAPVINQLQMTMEKMFDNEARAQ